MGEQRHGQLPQELHGPGLQHPQAQDLSRGGGGASLVEAAHYKLFQNDSERVKNPWEKMGVPSWGLNPGTSGY